MSLHTFDWIFIVLYFALSLGMGLYYAKRAGGSTREFFLSGRNLPWWLAGTSMVATTFAADTPLAVTELVAQNGIAGNWLWWNFVFGGILTVFFFARLWRRSGVMTDVEFAELRYSGKPAAYLRGFRALYLGIFLNAVIMGWVNLAMASILQGMFGIEESRIIVYLALCMAFVALYSALSGLWGVVVTDAFQFLIAMVGTVTLAVIVLALPEVGGVSGLLSQLPSSVFDVFPTVGNSEDLGVTGALALSLTAFLAHVGIQWWASWYPGAEPGGGGYVAQRMMSAKDEKHSVLATLWFTIAHYCVRPWPWILVGLATLVLYPELSPESKRMGYVFAMRDYLPFGIRGILVAAFFAAYMSTIATHLNWGTSYVINDFYRRFLQQKKGEKHYVFASRLVTVGLMIVSLLVTMNMETISGAWKFLIEAGAGLGLVLILRWYWWRINAWSEISAMVAPLVAYAYVKFYSSIQFPESLFFIVAFTTVVWLIVTVLTRPVDEDRLIAFYRRVHPGGLLWRRIARKVPEVMSDSGYGMLALDWLCGVVLVYAVLFGIGKIIFGDVMGALLYLTVAAVAGGVIGWDLARRPWKRDRLKAV
ncbi:MAG: sodium:solute symporter family protein [Bacteroidota bacterium]